MLLPLLLLLPSLQDPSSTASTPAPFVRLIEQESGLRLEMAVRRYHYRREEGPETLVSLVAAMHVGSKEYYSALQELLDSQDLVLFERVVDTDPAAALPQVTEAERARVAATYRRLTTLAGFLALHAEEKGDPARLAAAIEDPFLARRVHTALADGWGRPFRVEWALPPSQSVVRSLGADGKAGGEGLDADLELTLAEAPPLSSPGIQKTLADALGLIFQLDGIDYGAVNWRRLDVTLSQLRDLLDERGADAESLIAALRGDSVFATLASGLLKVMGATEQGRGMLALVGIETLARAEQLMERPPEGFEALFDVLVDKRNQVVTEGLRRVLEEEPDLATVAVFYGAGHLAPLSEDLTRRLGLEPLDETWIAGVELSYEETGLGMGTIRLLRSSIRRTLTRRLGKTRKGSRSDDGSTGDAGTKPDGGETDHEVQEHHEERTHRLADGVEVHRLLGEGREGSEGAEQPHGDQ